MRPLCLHSSTLPGRDAMRECLVRDSSYIEQFRTDTHQLLQNISSSGRRSAKCRTMYTHRPSYAQVWLKTIPVGAVLLPSRRDGQVIKRTGWGPSPKKPCIGSDVAARRATSTSDRCWDGRQFKPQTLVELPLSAVAEIDALPHFLAEEMAGQLVAGSAMLLPDWFRPHRPQVCG